MAGETETIETETPEPETVETATETPERETPAVDEEVVQLRERAARLEGELAALKRAPEPKKADPPLTAEAIEEAYRADRITDAQRIQYHAQLVAQQMREQERQQEARDRPLRRSQEKLEGFITKHPELRDPSSAEFQKVRDAARELVEETGWDIQDPRLQALAVERVVGGHRLGGAQVNERDIARRRIPTGGAGSGGSDGGGGKADPLKGIPAAMVAYWQEHNWIPDDAAKAAYAARWRAQQERRRSRVSA